VKNASRKQINNNYPILKRFHVKVDNTGENSAEMCKKTGDSDNRPNIISISHSEKNVNTKLVKQYKICILQK